MATAIDELSLDELKALAGERGVGIPADVERAQLIHNLHAAGVEVGASGETLDELRELANLHGVQLADDFVKAHLISALRYFQTEDTGGVQIHRLPS